MGSVSFSWGCNADFGTGYRGLYFEQRWIKGSETHAHAFDAVELNRKRHAPIFDPQVAEPALKEVNPLSGADGPIETQPHRSLSTENLVQAKDPSLAVFRGFKVLRITPEAAPFSSAPPPGCMATPR